MPNALTVEQTLTRLRHRLSELNAWRDRAEAPLAGTFSWSGGSAEVKPGDAWPAREVPVTLQFEATVPQGWSGPVLVDLAVGGEGLLLVDGVARGGLNPYHSEELLAESAQGGERFSLTVEAVPKGLFGSPEYAPALDRARLLLPDSDVRGLVEDLSAAHEAAGHLLKTGRPEVAELIADALAATFETIPVPRGDAAAYRTRMWQEPHERQMLRDRWEEWNFSGEPLPYPDEDRAALQAAREDFRSRIETIRQRYPAEGSLAMTGHAHIDLAWLWPLHETRRKARRTFATVLSLMERYPDFTFNQASAQAYAFVEEDDPELFGRIRQRVQEGRWDVVGGMWVEPDGNLISGESWARQLLLGQRYFQSRFGVTARVCWLPDTFGYAGNMPQLLQSAGIPHFFTIKLSWNETNTFPYDLYQWEALDGTRVLAHSFRNPGQGYNGTLNAHDTRNTWLNFRGKRQHTESLFSFGWGDGGGGPTFEMLERYERLKDFPAQPKLRMAKVADFYDAVPQDNLPVWVGEQYFELHRGTYTTQARVKQLNRAVEHALTDAETAATLATLLAGRDYPREAFQTAWEALLRNQFHDILPGSGVKSIYDDARRELGGALEVAERERDTALSALSDAHGTGERVVVWNLSFDDRPLSVRLKGLGEIGLALADGTAVQVERDGNDLIVVSEAVVPGLGYLSLSVTGAAEVAPSNASGPVLENEYLRAEIAPDGSVASLVDKTTGREALAGPGNQLWLYPDVPQSWEAWDVDASYEEGGVRLAATQAPERLSGTLEQAVRVRYDAQGSAVTQTYVLRAGSKRLEIRTEADWHARRLLLRALTPVNVRAMQASFETAYGTVTRTTHTNTSWDAAQFEVPGHRFADLSEEGFGVSLLTDAKYGYSAKGHVLGLSLLRGPLYPDPLADEGAHAFTYALYPHAGGWQNGTLREAHDLNAPLRAFRTSGAGNGEGSARLLTAGHGSLRLSALKLAEDGEAPVLRVYEAHGSRGEAEPDGLNLNRWSPVNLLEEDAGGDLSFTPYRVLSLRGGSSS